jgi:biotin-dependent carboxylase-like uncharacterized protein
MKNLKVIKNGILTLIQDKGRFGLNHLGVSHSGFLDEYSAMWANKLLDNSPNDSCLEILFGNVEFQTNCETNIAITGADCELSINGIKKQTWQNHFLKAGDTITIGKLFKGNRVYLSIKGGFDIKKEFGSVSTSIKENLGGINGKKILKGTLLPIKTSNKLLSKRVKQNLIPKYENILTLRVILSYQEQYFAKEQKDIFFNSKFKITNDFNSMACKLEGTPIKSDIDGIISEGISFGAIQIPKNSQPIILLKERQTIGGYPKIGSVLSIDCFKLSQAKVGSFIVFKPIDIKIAQEKTKLFYKLF